MSAGKCVAKAFSFANFSASVIGLAMARGWRLCLISSRAWPTALAISPNSLPQFITFIGINAFLKIGTSLLLCSFASKFAVYKRGGSPFRENYYVTADVAAVFFGVKTIACGVSVI